MVFRTNCSRIQTSNSKIYLLLASTTPYNNLYSNIREWCVKIWNKVFIWTTFWFASPIRHYICYTCSRIDLKAHWWYNPIIFFKHVYSLIIYSPPFFHPKMWQVSHFNSTSYVLVRYPITTHNFFCLFSIWE
jgi:hypothetical protein